MNQTIVTDIDTHLFKPMSWIYAFFRRIVLKKLNNLQSGRLYIHERTQQMIFGDSEDLSVHLRVYDVKFYTLCAFHGHLGFAEAYGKGMVDCDSLTDTLLLFANNLSLVDKTEIGLAWFANKIQYVFYRFFEANSIKRAKKNIHAHYDLSNDSFSTFLDKNMQYSAACYTAPSLTLDEAQLEKMRLICERLNLVETDHVLEIGSGWGGLAIYMAKNYGCKVTTITISEEQYLYAKASILREGLTQQIDIRLQDYRLIEGKFDKIVSIEMIEAVGHQYYQQYFDVCKTLLKPGGLFLMQAILIADHRYNQARLSVDFIKRYIFPGSNIPSLGILNECANHADFHLIQYVDITRDYALTLQTWQNRFNASVENLYTQGFDDHFIRMWNFYFSYCIAGFITKNIRDAHLVFSRNHQDSSP